jgi:hypothetical protein
MGLGVSSVQRVQQLNSGLPQRTFYDTGHYFKQDINKKKITEHYSNMTSLDLQQLKKEYEWDQDNLHEVHSNKISVIEDILNGRR